MPTDLSHIILAIAGFALVTLWAIQLWEVRALRKDNASLRESIMALTTAVAALTAELGHKVSKEDCAEHRSDYHRRHNDGKF